MDNLAEEATKDMVKRGLFVVIYKPPASWAERVNNPMWSRALSPRRGAQQAEGGLNPIKSKILGRIDKKRSG